jgi:predicted TIM-barrel fold metal-dependent hydrolase
MKNIYNCHTHTFNGRYVPSDFLKEFLQGNTKALVLGKILKTSFLGINKLAVWIVGKTSYSAFAPFLKVGVMKTQDMVFEDLKSNFPGDTRIVVLPLNFEYMGAGDVSISYQQQLDDLLEVRMRYPDQCLPFVFIDPRMGTAEQNLAFIQRYLGQHKGCVGIKLYPSLGYFPYDPRLYKVYEFAQSNQIPVISHCSKGGIFYDPDTFPETAFHSSSFNPQLTNKVDRTAGNPAPARQYDFKPAPAKEYKNNFIRPENYVDVLEKFPNLKLCFAHYGGDEDMLAFLKNGPSNTWYEQIKILISLYPNVYTDISYSLHDPSIREQIRKDFQDPVLRKRILFGTDYFMTLREPGVDEFHLYTDCLNTMQVNDFEVMANGNNRLFLTSAFYTAP